MKRKSRKQTKQITKSISPSKTNTVSKKGFWVEHRYAALILFSVPFLLYGYSLTFDYVLDDKMVLSENSFTQRGFSGIWDILSHDSFQGYIDSRKGLLIGGRYRPLSLVTFAVEVQLLGKVPLVSHSINILLYAFNGLLLFRLLNELIPEKKHTPFYYHLPFIVSLLFVLHPIHSEVVANIKGRDEILALLGCLATLYFLLKARSLKRHALLISSGCVFLLALLAKENAITFVAIIPLTFYFFTDFELKHFRVVCIPLLVATLVYVGVRYWVMGYFLNTGMNVTGLMNNPFLGATVAEKFATIFYTLGLYAKLMFFPRPLTHDYYPYHIPIIGWDDPRSWASLMLYMVMIGYAVSSFREKNIVSFSILYFLCTLSIVSNLLIPVGTFMNERFVYMPSVGFCLLLGYIITRLLADTWFRNLQWGRRVSLVLLAVIVSGYGFKTITRVPAWKNTMSLNRAAVSVSTGSARANCFMGVALYTEAAAIKEDLARKLSKYEEAEYYIDKALSIYPSYPDALKMKAGILAENFKHDRDLGKLLNGFYDILKVRHLPYVDKYLEYLNRRRLDIDRLIDFYHRTGFLLFAEQLRNYSLALKYLNYGVSLDPDNLTLLLDLTKIYYFKKDYRKILKIAERGLALDAENKEFEQYVGLALKGLAGRN